MAWRAVVTDLSGTAIGELANAYDRKLYRGLNRTSTFTFRLRLDNPYADSILNAQALLKVYDGTTLRFNGVVAGLEEVGSGDGSGGSIAVTCAGPLWRLGHRLIGKTTTGYAQGSASSLVDAGTIMSSIVTACNTDYFTGITIGTITTGSTNTYVAYAPYKKALEALSELSSLLAGPDFEVVPTEPTTIAGATGALKTQLGLLNVSPVIGSAKPDAVFEYGTGRRNVNEYRRQVGLDGLLNSGYGLDPAGGAAYNSVDSSSQNTYGLYEDVVPTNDLTVTSLRSKLVDEHVRVRKAPRQIITFSPSRDDASQPGRVPRFGTDFGLGDSVTFRAVQALASGPTTRINAALRVYAVEFAIDDVGAAVPTFTLTAD